MYGKAFHLLVKLFTHPFLFGLSLSFVLSMVSGYLASVAAALSDNLLTSIYYLILGAMIVLLSVFGTGTALYYIYV